MWTRRNVKRRGKNAMRANYWKTVLVSLILTCILGGSSGAAGAGAGSGFSSGMAAATGAGMAATAESGNDAVQSQALSGDINNPPIEGLSGAETPGTEAAGNPAGVDAVVHELPDVIMEHMPGELSNIQIPEKDKRLFLILLAVFVLVISIIVILIDAFLFNPLEVGIRRFFFLNMRRPAEIKEVAYGYDNKYLKNVKVIFLRDLFLFLWSLLLVFPGIIKSYSYRMVPYILADQPELTRKEVFALSKKLMRGNKWKAFVLDLSFIGWYILSVLTLGILFVFYVSPYKDMTDAALYEKLMYGRKTGQEVQGMQGVPVPMLGEDDEEDE